MAGPSAHRSLIVPAITSDRRHGQLYVNLRGYDPSGTPLPPAEAIRGFLDALGVPATRIPAAPQAQAGLYRSLLSGRRVLILLDNARDSTAAAASGRAHLQGVEHAHHVRPQKLGRVLVARQVV